MIKSIEKNKLVEYNDIILNVNNYEIDEPGNPYGHTKEFKRLKNNIKYEAHRVIAPLAIRLIGIEDKYSVTDINGNTYIFDIFEDGYYRVSEVRRLKERSKENASRQYNKKNN